MRKPKPKALLAPPVPKNGRFMVTVGTFEAEVVVSPEGMVLSADEPLDDWVEGRWEELVADAKQFAWKIRDLNAPPAPKEAKAPPMRVTGIDPAVGGGKSKIMEAIRQAGPPPVLLPKLGREQIERLMSVPNGVIMPNDSTAWSTSAADLEKTAKAAEIKAEAAEAEVRRLRNEFAVAMAKEGRGIDEMNKAIFSQPAFTRAQEQRLRQIVEEVVARVLRMMGEEAGAHPDRIRQIEERIYRESHERARREFAAASTEYAIDPNIKPFDPFGKGRW